MLWVVLFGVAADAAPVEWPQFHGSVDHRGVNKAEDTVGHPTCKPLWKGDAGTYVESSPAVSGGRVFIEAGDAQLKVFDANGCGKALCQPEWVGFGPGPQATIQSSPMVANGVVYVGENNGRVYAFRARGCKHFVCERAWEFITQDAISNSSPVMVNGTLYVSGTNFGELPELYVFRLFGS